VLHPDWSLDLVQLAWSISTQDGLLQGLRLGTSSGAVETVKKRVPRVAQGGRRPSANAFSTGCLTSSLCAPGQVGSLS
jgi:hypothetical protein